MNRVAAGWLVGIALFGCQLDRGPAGGEVSGLPSAIFGVGAEGTSRKWPDGAEVDIPANALTESAVLGFRAMDADNSALPPLPADLQAASAIYACTPHGQEFQKPVRVTMPHWAEDHLTAVVLTLDDPEDDEWEAMPAGVKFTEALVTLSVNHFSFFVVVEPSAPGEVVCGNSRVEAGEACDDGENDGRYGGCMPGCGERAPYCGDGEIDEDEGEVCDPPGTCPSQTQCLTEYGCAGGGYEGDPDECTAYCPGDVAVSVCVSMDGCCPDGCTPEEDGDCAVCGDGVLDPGESCEAGTERECPSDCDDGIGCTSDVLEGEGTCNASCDHESIIDIVDGDGCCPPEGDSTTDSDCSPDCGDGVIDPEAGETCEPGVDGGCVTACDDDEPCTRDVLSGSAANCNAACSFVEITTPVPGDQCCPTGANANTDNDCDPVCGNGIPERTEQCDGADCPTDVEDCDDNIACTADQLLGAPDLCTARCVNTPITAPANNDGCCPASGNANNDNDCGVQCGNGAVEPGETCDPLSSCPNAATCTAQFGGCGVLQVPGNACTAFCTEITDVENGDGCCPDGADAGDDNDCAPRCGDGIRQGDELCDGDCPSAAQCVSDDACVAAVFTGSAATCDAVCVRSEIVDPNNGDGCCPEGGNGNNDDDCDAVCGNGTVEGVETCEPQVGAGCPSGDLCVEELGSCGTVDFEVAGNRCTAFCTTITAFVDDDGCCPEGGDPDNDSDCTTRQLCGNGIIDEQFGETCDVQSANGCPNADTCNGAVCGRLVFGQDGNACTARCERIVEVSEERDGCCPDGTEGDPDCAQIDASIAAPN